ncbi:hypothetical protein [Paludisphaera mucosa]|uniref:PNPLA domain-containing protein n=1 Tax=Paludisphaera mucosa TaxID=3030827 RepID=A0ABT6FK62_9BACT|nr:hypothetical protein [Paludisphaera mucosa]MDG3007886.1 hypothetical protein [Paludisphaera mucosa]
MSEPLALAMVRGRLGTWNRLPFVLIPGLLVLAPWCLHALYSFAPELAPKLAGKDDPAAAMVENGQQTVIVLVFALALLGFGRFVPALWSLCQSSLSGLLIAAEFGLVYWIVYGGLAGVGMPGLFWHFDPSVRLRAAFGVTIFTYWMLYLLFIRDYEVHRHEPGRQIWTRFFPALEASGLPAPLALRPTATAPALQEAPGPAPSPPAPEPAAGGAGLDAIRRLRWFLGVAGLPALLALALPALIPVARPVLLRARGPQGGVVPGIVDWPWLGGLAAGVMAVALLAGSRAPTRLHALWHAIRRRASRRGLDRDRLDPHANMKNIIIILTLVFLASYVDEWWAAAPGLRWTYRLFPAAFSMCVALGVLATAATWMGTRSWATRIAFGAVLAALLSAGGALDYEVQLRDLENLYPSATDQYSRHLASVVSKPDWYRGVVDLQEFQRARMTPAAATEATTRRLDLLKNWRGSFEGTGRRPILVVVAASGGALRAGVWTETVLGYLDGVFEDFPHHVRLIAGASGGMLGAARFVADQVHGRGMPGGPPGTKGARKVPPDYLTPIAWQIAFRDFVPNALIPRAMRNRGDALEDAWAGVDAGINLTFADLLKGEEAGRIPSIVFSPMMSEDGRRLLISNQPLADLASNAGRSVIMADHARLAQDFLEQQGKEPDDYDLEYPAQSSISAVEFFRLFESSRPRVRLASAVRMSATFPYVTSTVVLPTYPPRHVVDAGYYDNYGVNLASAWIASHARWLAENTSGVLFVQVRAFPNEARLKKLDRNVLASGAVESRSVWSRIESLLEAVPKAVGLAVGGLQALAIPFEGIAQARDSSMYFRNDAQLNGLHETFKALSPDAGFFRTVVFTCDTSPVVSNAPNVETLNWYLDPVEYEGIRRNMENVSADRQTGRLRNHLRFAALLDWWRSRGGAIREAAEAPRTSTSGQ